MRQFKKLVLIIYSGWKGLSPWEPTLISAGLAAKQETNCHKTLSEISLWRVRHHPFSLRLPYEFSSFSPWQTQYTLKKVFKYSYSKYTHFVKSFPFPCKLLRLKFFHLTYFTAYFCMFIPSPSLTLSNKKKLIGATPFLVLLFMDKDGLVLFLFPSQTSNGHPSQSTSQQKKGTAGVTVGMGD